MGEDKTGEARFTRRPGKSDEYSQARAAIEPDARHAMVAVNASAAMFHGRTSLAETVEAIRDISDETAGQDMSAVSRLLTSQALSLDALYTQLTTRAHMNMRDYPEAMERYMRLAMKAQGQSRATLEALIKLHQPREQIVRHIHVDNRGGQAVIAETVTTGGQNVIGADQPHAQGACGPALPRSDARGISLPVSGDQGEGTMPTSRRPVHRRTKGQP